MKKNILKRFIVLFSLGFILLGYNFVSAELLDPTPDTTAPVITLTGTSPVNLTVGDTYTDAGAIATDDINGDVTSNIVSVNNVNTALAGTYTVTYDVKDVALNSAIQIVRTVVISEVVPPTPASPIYQDVVVKDNCTVVDTDGVSHVFPVENSVSKFLGICALLSAKEAKYIDSFELVNDPSMGLYLKNINATVLGSSEYWALWLNGGFASCGVGCLPVVVGDKLDLVLTDWMTSTESTKILLRISSLESTPIAPVIPVVESSGGGGYIQPVEKTFSISSAISYLSAKQKDDGSFGDSLYTDWSAIAISLSSDNNLKSKVINYLKNNLLDSSTVTDNERHAMALMSLDINPYSGTSVDYIKKITDSFDGVQFGDASLDNDDIFALIVLSKAGYSLSDEKITKDINYLISKQSSDGSWGSVDLTSASIQALNNFRDVSGVSDSISKALKYLAKSQQSDGGFGNSFSTSWAIGSLSTEGSLYVLEIQKADAYLALKQQSDGGVDEISNSDENRIWATAYTIPAILHKSWGDILNNFSKPIQSNFSSNPAVEKIIINPIVDLPKVEVKSIEEKIINKNPIKNKRTKNIKVEKPIVKAIEKNGDIKNYINPSTIESLPTFKRSIFSEVSNTINLKFKAFLGWLLVSLGF